MTAKLAALQRLHDAVVEGTAKRQTFAEAFTERGIASPYWNASSAYDGSLDAAKALHEALLPGWEWRVVERRAWVWSYPSTLQGGDEIEDDDGAGLPARAWLLAVIKALMAQEGE